MKWLSIIIIIAIVLVLADGFLRKFRSRSNLRVKLEKNVSAADLDDEPLGPEFPSGGARTIRRDTHEPVFNDRDADDVLLEEEKLYDNEYAEYDDARQVDDEDASKRHDYSGHGYDEHAYEEAAPAFEALAERMDPAEPIESAEALARDDSFVDVPQESAELPPEETAVDDFAEQDFPEPSAEQSWGWDETADDDDAAEVAAVEDAWDHQVARDEPVEDDQARDEQTRNEQVWESDSDTDNALAVADVDVADMNVENGYMDDMNEMDDMGDVDARNGWGRDDTDELDEIDETPSAEQPERDDAYARTGSEEVVQNELFLDDDDELDDAAESEADDGELEVEEVIVINVMAPAGSMLAGKEMLRVLLKQGMRLGNMSIFHRHADSNGSGPVMFSMANMVKPGTFDMAQMETFTTPGVSLFLQLPGRHSNFMQSFERMLETANALKDTLGGELKDENRSVLTRQTVEHYRQCIRDFELRQLSRK